MKKYILPIIIIFISFKSTSQNSDYKNIKEEFIKEFAIKACDCFSGVTVESNEKLGECFNEIENEFKAKYDSHFEKLEKEGKVDLVSDLIYSVQAPMIKNCASISNYFKEIRTITIERFYQSKDQNKLDSLNQVKDRDANYFLTRGKLNFAAKNYEKAISDFKTTIQMSSQKEFQNYMLLAWVYYAKGDLNGSISIYNEALQTNKSPELKAYLELTKIEISNTK